MQRRGSANSDNVVTEDEVTAKSNGNGTSRQPEEAVNGISGNGERVEWMLGESCAMRRVVVRQEEAASSLRRGSAPSSDAAEGDKRSARQDMGGGRTQANGSHT